MDFGPWIFINLILIGFKSCGKTVIGKELAYRLKWRFIDLDHVVESLYREKHGQKLSSREIFKNHGESYFRGLEKQALERLEHINCCVLSTGGGTFIYNSLSIPLRKNSKVIYLKVNPEVLYRRIIARGIPAFFQPDRPYESFQRLLEERIPVYERLADLVIDNSTMGIENAVRKILEWLEVVLETSLS
ncbi:MAG TPA: shikimate kinase [Candidatus Limnocylindrales bacterium]|nr:shikimate kinase [Candidatus Limnocylindrales bacterium]